MSFLFNIQALYYHGTSRTAAPIRTISGPGVDPPSTFSTAVSPGPPRCPQHWQRTGLFLVAQPGNKAVIFYPSHAAVMSVNDISRHTDVVYKWSTATFLPPGAQSDLTSPLDPGQRRFDRRGEARGCCRTAAALQIRYHSCCCTGPRKTRGSSRHSCVTREFNCKQYTL